MEVQGDYFSTMMLTVVGMISAFGIMLAAYMAPWSRILRGEYFHVFAGSCVFLMVMWMIRAEVYEGIEFHLLFLTTLTLMFGWSLAVIGGCLSLLALAIAGVSSWPGLLINITAMIIIPATFSQVALVLVRHWLPRHFFVYIYVNAFFAGGLAILLSSLFSSLMLSLTPLASFSQLWETYLTYFPLMFFPEAVLNGWFITLLVSYRPQWVRSFSDSEYLLGK